MIHLNGSMNPSHRGRIKCSSALQPSSLFRQDHHSFCLLGSDGAKFLLVESDALREGLHKCLRVPRCSYDSRVDGYASRFALRLSEVEEKLECVVADFEVIGVTSVDLGVSRSPVIV